MKAKNREHYLESWKHHINQLCTLAIDADLEYEEWKKIEKKLNKILDAAADECFPIQVGGDMPEKEEA
jgi:hypothetical protein